MGQHRPERAVLDQRSGPRRVQAVRFERIADRCATGPRRAEALRGESGEGDGQRERPGAEGTDSVKAGGRPAEVKWRKLRLHSMITYRTGNNFDLDQVIELYRASTLGERRPIDEPARMAKM